MSPFCTVCVLTTGAGAGFGAGFGFAATGFGFGLLTTGFGFGDAADAMRIGALSRVVVLVGGGVGRLTTGGGVIGRETIARSGKVLRKVGVGEAMTFGFGFFSAFARRVDDVLLEDWLAFFRCDFDGGRSAQAST